MQTPQQCGPLPCSSPAALAFQPALCPAYNLTRIATATRRCAAVAADIADVSQSARTREILQNAEVLPRISGKAQDLRHHPQGPDSDFETGANLPLSGYSLCPPRLMGYNAIRADTWGLFRALSLADALSSDSCRCEPEQAPLRVALLLSGGVDSSLALRLLQAAGHEVTAFYLQVPSFPYTHLYAHGLAGDGLHLRVYCHQCLCCRILSAMVAISPFCEILLPGCHTVLSMATWWSVQSVR